MSLLVRSASTFLAVQNARQHPSRTAATVASIGFSILLVFMQLGFYATARRAHTLLFELLEFDLMLTSERFESLKNVREFPAARLFQARAIPGVAAASGLNVDWARWIVPATGRGSSCMLVGLDLDPSFCRDPLVRGQLDILRKSHVVLVDQLSSPAYGPLQAGGSARLNAANVTIGGLFRMGTDFKADGRALASNATFRALQRQAPDRLNLGMIRLLPDADPRQVRADLIRLLPADVRLFDRQTFIRQEQDYYTRVKPIGLFFQAGVIVACCVGAVILFQVLAADIAARFAEFATLKAIGASSRFVYAIGFQQALLYGLCSYLPALLLATGIFSLVRRATRLPIAVDLSLAVLVLLLTFVMCALSSILALRRVRHADPAELF